MISLVVSSVGFSARLQSKSLEDENADAESPHVGRTAMAMDSRARRPVWFWLLSVAALLLCAAQLIDTATHHLSSEESESFGDRVANKGVRVPVASAVLGPEPVDGVHVLLARPADHARRRRDLGRRPLHAAG